jgi:hypothetical protein
MAARQGRTTMIPQSPAELTPAWLTGALRAAGTIDASTSVVRAHSVLIGEGVGFMGQVARVRLAYDRGSGPSSLIAKLPGMDPGARAVGNLFRFYEREIRFYDDLRDRISLRAPLRYASAMELGSQGFALLIEDLAPARPGDQAAGCDLTDAETLVRELARFHAAWWERPELDSLGWMPVYGDPVHHPAQAAYDRAWPSFVEQFGSRLEPDMRAACQKLAGRVVDIEQRLSDRPHTIMHGDFKLDNILFAPIPGGAPFAVLDWQITSRGRGAFDLGYLLCTSLRVDDRRAHGDRLVRLYLDELVRAGVRGYGDDDCARDVRLAALFRFVYTVITLGTFDLANERGRAVFNAMLERNTAAVLDLDAATLL